MGGAPAAKSSSKAGSEVVKAHTELTVEPVGQESRPAPSAGSTMVDAKESELPVGSTRAQADQQRSNLPNDHDHSRNIRGVHTVETNAAKYVPPERRRKRQSACAMAAEQANKKTWKDKAFKILAGTGACFGAICKCVTCQCGC